jgi:putative ATP-dependent endonuclease of OLD family
MYDLAIRAKNYKCFKEETGFDTIRRVNLIIGRNNAGKSS